MDSRKDTSQEKDGALPHVQLKTQNNEGKTDAAIPLCLPDNWNWDPRTGKCVKTGNSRSSLDVIEEALEQLRKIKGPVCVVSIAGKLRMGKSFVLSEAFDQPDVFPLGHEMEPETMGIWLWIVPEKYKDPTSGREFTVVLLDSEGIDSAEGEGFTDHQIFTLTVLLASVLIFNSHNVATRHDIDGLDFIAKLTQRIQIRSNCGEADDSKDDDEFFHKTFPYFVWLLRDSLLSIPKDCNDLKDYFLKKVLYKQKSPSTKQGSEKVAESILRFFPDFDPFRLPTPTDKPEVLTNLKEKRSQASPLFWSRLEEFKQFLRPKLTPKKSFNDGEFVTGEGLAALVQLYIKEINTPGSIPNVQRAWDTFVEEKCSDAKQTALVTYDALLTSQLSGFLPCDNNKIRLSHKAALQESEGQFMEDMAGFSTNTVELHAREFKASIEKKLQSWRDENEKRTRKFCKDLLGHLKKRHLEPFLQQLQGTAGAKLSVDEVIGGYKRVQDDYHNNARGAEDVIAAVFYEFHPELVKEKEQNLSWLRQLKASEQERIQRLAAEAYVQKIKKQLEEDKKRLLRENEEQRKEMELLIANLQEDKKRLREQMAHDLKKQRVQLENMMETGWKEAQKEREAFIKQNNDLRNRNMEMQKANEEHMEMIKKFSDLAAVREKEKEEIRQQMKTQADEEKKVLIKEIDEKYNTQIGKVRTEMTAKVNEAIALYSSTHEENNELKKLLFALEKEKVEKEGATPCTFVDRGDRAERIYVELETNDDCLGKVEKPGFFDFVAEAAGGVLSFFAPVVKGIVDPLVKTAEAVFSECSVM